MDLKRAENKEDASVRFEDPEHPCGSMQLWRARIEDLPSNSIGLKMSRFSVEVGGRTLIDRHVDSEVWMVASGEGMLRFRDSIEMAIVAGDAVRFLPHESHVLSNTGRVPLIVFSIWWEETVEPAV